MTTNVEFRRAWRAMIEELITSEKIHYTTQRTLTSDMNAELIVALYTLPKIDRYVGNLVRYLIDSPQVEGNTRRVLKRWEERYGLLRSDLEVGDQRKLRRPLRVVYTLTNKGTELAALATDEPPAPDYPTPVSSDAHRRSERPV